MKAPAAVVLVGVLSACSPARDRREPTVTTADTSDTAASDAGPTPGPTTAHVDADLTRLQSSLGDAASSCRGTAVIFASRGVASKAKRAWRERAVEALCVEDRWPAEVRECAATAGHDPLSCTAHLETDPQRDRWNHTFESWLDDPPPAAD